MSPKRKKLFRQGELVRLMRKPGGKYGYGVIVEDEDQSGMVAIRLTNSKMPTMCMHEEVTRKIPKDWIGILTGTEAAEEGHP
jgi:hypothetical protein